MWILYFLLTLFLLSILVVIHEGGHFLVARLSGIKVLEFSVGMGPALLSRTSKKSGIKYSLRTLPFGGYVQMDGEDGESADENAFYRKPVRKRLATVLAGPVMNILFGFLCMFILVCISTPVSTVIAGFQEDARSPEFGLMEEDRIIAVNGTPVHNGNDLVYEIMYQGNKPLDLTVVRNGEKIILSGVKFPVYPTEETDGVELGRYDFVLYAMRKTPGNILSQAFFRSVNTVKMVFDTLKDLITGRFGVEAFSGPVGITSAVGEAASAGFSSILYLITVISVNLGIMNLLPLPALDGGRIIMLLIEAVIRRPVNRKVEGYINTAGLVVLLGFMFFITAKDIFKLFI
ncbi:MAG: site-2 protease family protein [Clostridia bacterium]|nr:site-2 protease family protein [Clostridia bacterium]